jgi:hypothetical protein
VMAGAASEHQSAGFRVFFGVEHVGAAKGSLALDSANPKRRGLERM